MKEVKETVLVAMRCDAMERGCGGENKVGGGGGGVVEERGGPCSTLACTHVRVGTRPTGLEIGTSQRA